MRAKHTYNIWEKLSAHTASTYLIVPMDSSDIKTYSFAQNPFIPLYETFEFKGERTERTIHPSYAIGGASTADHESEKETTTGRSASLFRGKRNGCETTDVDVCR